MGYGKKYIVLQGPKLTMHDAEKGECKGDLVLNSVTRTAEQGGEMYGLLITGQSGTEWALRAGDGASFVNWYNTIYAVLQSMGKVRPRNCGLPPEDPRTKLPFVDVPPEHLAKFVYLDSSVLHWFSPVKKLGVKSAIALKTPIEERIVVLGDKYIYVCKPTGDITRCMKILDIAKIFASGANTPAGQDGTIGISMKAPDYDILFTVADANRLVGYIRQVYKYLTKGRDLPVVEAAPNDITAQCNLARPDRWEMVLVLPTSKSQLKKAFDVFAQKTGLKVLPDAKTPGSPAGAVSQGGPASPSGGGGAPAPGGKSEENEAPGFVPRTDPMGFFLIKLNLEQYYAPLRKQKVDIDVLEFMEEADLTHFGITDPAHRKRILDTFGNPVLIEEIRNEAALLRQRAKAKGAEGSKEEEYAPLAPTQSTQPAAPAKPVDDVPPPKPKGPISLDDDDDLLPPPKPAAKKAAISLDDDDDDLPPPKPKPKISLDDDDDDLPPPKPAAKKAVIDDI
eukprot:PhF_6_TR38140/c0_g1_i1/m.56965